MPSHSPSVARSALWNHAGRLTDYVAWYCSSVLIARGLGVELNGILAGMMSGVHLLLAFSSLGLEVAVNKFIPQIVGDDIAPRARAIVRRAALVRLLLYLLVAVLFLAGFRWVIGDQAGMTSTALMVLLFYGLFRGLSSLAAMVLVARWHTDRAAVITGATRLFELGVLIVLFNIGMDLLPVILVLTCTLALQVMGYVTAAKEYWVGPETRVPMRPVWVFGSIFWANTVVDYFLGRQGDILFITLLSPHTSSAALYDVAYSILQAGSMVVTVGFSGVTLAAFARLALGERSGMDRFYGSLVRITSFLVIPVLGFLIVSASDIIELLYSDAYAGAAVVLQVLLTLRIVARLFAGGENADYLLALDRVSEIVWIGIVGAGVTIGLHLILIPRFDVVGAAWAAGIGAGSANVLGVLRVRRYGAATIEWRTWGLVVVITAVAGFIVFLLPSSGSTGFDVIARGILFMGCFTGLVMVLRPLERHDSDTVASVSPRLQRTVFRMARKLEDPG